MKPRHIFLWTLKKCSIDFLRILTWGLSIRIISVIAENLCCEFCWDRIDKPISKIRNFPFDSPHLSTKLAVFPIIWFKAFRPKLNLVKLRNIYCTYWLYIASLFLKQFFVISRGQKINHVDDPSVALFCEHFAPKQEISEICLTMFMHTLFSSQISVTPPQILSQLIKALEK